MKRHWWGTLCYLVGSGAQRGLPFLLLPLFTRTLTTDQFGSLSLATSAAAVFAIVLGLNPQVYLIASFHGFDREKLNAVLSNSVVAVLVSAAGAVLAGIAWIVWGPGGAIGVTVVVAVVVLGAGRTLLGLFLALIQLRRRPLTFLTVNLALAGATAIAIVFVLLFRGGAWQAALGAEAVAVGMAALLLTGAAYLRGDLAPAITRGPLDDFLRFAVPLLPHTVALWIMAFIDRVMLAVIVDTETVGLYSAAYTLGLGLSLFYEAFQRSWQPVFFAEMGSGTQGGAATAGRITRYAMTLTVLVGVAYLAVAIVALPIVAGDEYRSAVPWMWPIVLGYILLGGYRIAASYLYATGSTGVLSTVTVCGALLNAGANLILIPRMGAMGAALATMGAYAFTLLGVLFLVRRIGLTSSRPPTPA